jgi:Cu+-exporting ATPase
MTCTGCAASIQRALEARDNVDSASVSFIAGTANVAGHLLQPGSIIEVIRGRGFEAELIDSTESVNEFSEIERQQQSNERRWRHRAIVGMGLWVPLELLHWIATAMHWHGEWMLWVMFFGSLVIILFAGSEFYKSAGQAAIRGTTNMDTLISIGATTAFVYSTIVLLLKLEQPTYFAEAAGLLGIVSLGHWFEARASSRAGSAVRELLRMQPETSEIMSDDGSVRIVSSLDVQRGWKMIVRPGGRIGVDGIVVEGQSAVDQSIVTGESIPVDKNPGDSVVAGSMNTTGRLIVKATVDGRNTTVARIAGLVQKAQTSRAPIQRLADQVAAIFVPTVLAIAALTLVGWYFAGDIPKGVIAAVTVLIISCPCALGLATPMAVMVGTGAASQRGILIRDAATLERLGRAERIVFDKTGTLTRGEPVVGAIEPEGMYSRDELLRIAASVESPSEHPIAKAIVREAKAHGLALSPVDHFIAIPGRGVQGRIGSQNIIVERDVRTTSRVLVDGLCIGTLTLQDRLRVDAVDAVHRLNRLGMRVSMLTGDRRETAESIANELGIEAANVISEATPETKAAHVGSLGEGVVMVGDGLNDAAALATSGLGIALASGTVVAIEAAAVVIPGDRVAAVPELIQLARESLRTIKQNLFFAFFYNALAIPVAAFGLLGPSGPLWAALAMGASDITVIGNALWLRRKLATLARRDTH